MDKKLVRSSDRMFAGVAAGIADYVNIDPTIIRLLFVLLALTGGGGVILYFIMWLVMPELTSTVNAKVIDADEAEVA